MDNDCFEIKIDNEKKSFRKIQDEKPAIILINPSNGYNIGSISRVMANFGLSDLRIVKTPFDHDMLSKAKILATSHGSDILDNIRFFENLEDAVEDIDFLLAFTARLRGSKKENYEIQNVIPIAVKNVNKAGFMFGNESSGLTNEEIELSHATCYIPTNPDHKCLNLSQSVAVSLYQWFQDYCKVNSTPLTKLETATMHDLNLFFDYTRNKIIENGNLEKNRRDIVCEFRDFCLRTYCTKRDLRLLYRVVEFLSEKKEN